MFIIFPQARLIKTFHFIFDAEFDRKRRGFILGTSGGGGGEGQDSLADLWSANIQLVAFGFNNSGVAFPPRGEVKNGRSGAIS